MTFQQAAGMRLGKARKAFAEDLYKESAVECKEAIALLVKQVALLLFDAEALPMLKDDYLIYNTIYMIGKAKKEFNYERLLLLVEEVTSAERGTKVISKAEAEEYLSEAEKIINLIKELK